MAQQELQAKREEKEHDTLTKYLIKGYEIPPPALQELLTLEARNTTLLALGGPDGNTVDPHGNWWASHPTVLAKAIRGAWRWWLRTLLQPKYNAENYQKLWEKEEELGLGSTSKATCYIIEVELIEPKKISGTPLSTEEIHEALVEIIDKEKLGNKDKGKSKNKKDILNKLLNKIRREGKATLRLDSVLKEDIQDPTEKLIAYMLTKLRYYVLLTTPYKSVIFTRRNRRELENLTPESLVQKLKYRGEHLYEFLYRKQPLLPGQLTIKVTLYRRKACTTRLDDLAKKALIYALTIGGIGAATTRGFGKFAIINNENNEKSKKVEGNNKKSNEVQQIQEEILEQYEDRDEQSEWNIKLTPLPDINKAIKIEIRLSETQNILDILAKISDAVKKIIWKFYTKEWGYKYHTWVLGLPRSMAKKRNNQVEIVGGYFIKGEKIGRWKSPLIFTPIKEDDGWKILLTLFPLEKDIELLLKEDSEYLLYWKGKYNNKKEKHKKIKVKEHKVKDLPLKYPDKKDEQSNWTAEDAYIAALKWVIKILESR